MTPRIMVIEDDPDVLAMIGLMLNSVGYEAILSPTIVDDLTNVAALAPDLMLIDMMFGREPLGAHLLGSLLADRSTANIPLIACTGSSRVALMAQDFLRELKIPLLRKPFVLEDLVGAIDQALASVPTTHGALD